MLLACVAVASLLCVTAAHGQDTFEMKEGNHHLALALSLPEVKLIHPCTQRCTVTWFIIEPCCLEFEILHTILNRNCDGRIKGGGSLNHGYNISCEATNSGTYSVLYLPNLTATRHNGTKIFVGIQSRTNKSEVLLTFEDCEYKSLELGNRLNIVPPYEVGYNSSLTLTCSSGSHLYNGNRRIAEGFALSRCNWKAELEDLKNYTCWHAPNVTLNKHNGDEYFSPDQPVNFICSLEPGYPYLTNIILSIRTTGNHILYNGSESGNVSAVFNIGMIPMYNGAILQCNASNEYTEGNRIPAIKSNSETLNVMFGPVGLDHRQSCFKSYANVTCINIVLEFFANAKNLSVKYSNGSLGGGRSALVPSNVSYGVEQMRYQEHIKVVGNVPTNFLYVIHYQLLDDEIYNHTSNFSVKKRCPDCYNPTTHLPNLTTGTITEGDSPGRTEVVIVAAVASGGGALLLLAVFTLACIIRRRRYPNQKQEVSNPIYATTSVMSKGHDTSSPHESKTDKLASEKEERENPLYGTTSDATYAPVNKKKKNVKQAITPGQQAETNETYASINKVREGKKKNKVFNEQTPADETYMPLDKIKKGKKQKDKNGQSNDGFSKAPEAMYAAVNKNKDKAGGSDQPSTSGLGYNGDAAQECTYAAVQKKGSRKPKRDGSDDEDLHGSTKP